MKELIDAIGLQSGSPFSAFVSEWGPSFAVFVIAAVAFYLMGRVFTRKPSPEQMRLKRISPDSPLGQMPREEGLIDALAPALAVQLPETEKEQRDFKLLLRQAGLYSPRARVLIYALRFVLLVAPLIVAGVWAVMADADQTFAILFGGGITAATLSVVPRLYVYFRRRRRLQRIRAGLPDSIDMLSMCTSGGLGLSESLDHVAGQLSSYPEVAQELMILKKQAEIGSLKQALADFSVRIDLPEARQLAGLLTRGTRLGTQLAGSLNEQADHLRVARRQAATMRANKTPVKLVFPILFCFAPAALILLTAPAVLELRDFLNPSESTATAPGEGFGTEAIIRTLEDLNQTVNPTVSGPAPAEPERF